MNTKDFTKQLDHVLGDAAKVQEGGNFSEVLREELNVVLYFRGYATDSSERNCFCQLTEGVQFVIFSGGQITTFIKKYYMDSNF